MKIRSVLAGAFSVAALILSAAPVQAAVEAFSFSDNVDGIFANGDFTVANTANANGTFDITNITGTVINDSTGVPAADVIGGLIANPSDPNPTIADGFIYDNVTPLNTNGVLFQGATTGAIYNLWSNGGKAGELYTYGLPGVPNFDALGTLTLGVPEPATWAMMLVGFGGLGGALRGARRKRALAA